MKRESENRRVEVRCPDCGLTIENVTAEAMVYCRACRKWCREREAAARAATQSGSSAPPKPKRQRPPRCH